MFLSDIVATSEQVRSTRSRLAKIDALAACLRRLTAEEIEIGVAFLSGETLQGKLGIGYAALREAAPPGAQMAVLTLQEVDRALSQLGATSGAGSNAQRKRLLGELFARATAQEQQFLVRLLIGELRQGALEGIMIDALAKAADLPTNAVRRATMLAGALAPIAKAALTGGLACLAQFSLRLFSPIQPMLAQPAEDIAAAMAQLSEAALDWKLDGARVQVHKFADEVRVFSRSLNEVTAAVPEIVEITRSLPARALILDGEAIALRPDGAPQPFQITMRRFGRKLDVHATRAELPIGVFFFDCLKLDDDELIDRPGRERAAAMDTILPPSLIVPHIVTDDVETAQNFFDAALRAGHEGVMAKSLSAPYDAGSRGASWLKVKQAATLDLVVLAVEWGSGRRVGWLSNLHLGARDPGSGGFVMLGKTFKGMTDAMLAWQTEKLLSLEVSRDNYTVFVRPELVAEIAFNDLQASSQYPGGIALRFARVKRYRTDKSAAEADTIETVRALYARQFTSAA
jgi:DNA ligase-1